MKRLLMLLGALVIALWVGAGQALAEEGGGASQGAGQSANSGQEADGKGDAYQSGPTNSATSIRVLSPGDDGAVTQSNTTLAGALAANANKTNQSTTQSQTGGAPGSDYAQIAAQSAKNDQDADADATAKQIAPSNDAQSIRVLSPGDNGKVDQSNTATAGAAALNGNKTDQSIDQSQGGSGHGSDDTQIAGQEAKNDQDADADAKAVQVKPSNSATSIRVLSPGDDGDVTQSNDATAIGIAANGNKTKQSIDQSQAGSGHGSDHTQIAGQLAKNDQDADADAKAVQVKPSNTASSIRVLSPNKGDGGDVSQSNSTTAVAAALNANKTKQSIDQEQGSEKPAPMKSDHMKSDDKKSDDKKSDKGASHTQIAGQFAKNDQDADADAKAVQVKPSNDASSIRVLSPGDDGDVTQSNDATAIGIAANLNKTKQSIDQEQGSEKPAPMKSDHMKSDDKKPDDKKSDKGASYTQIAGQFAENDQDADADAKAVQVKPSNTASSIRVLSPNKGDGGDVTQSNDATAVGIALNANKTKQSIDQTQSGHGQSADYAQVAGQAAKNDQDADADAKAVQIKPSNSNESIRVLSKGDDGDVSQSNSTTALAAALNLNATHQSIDQSQAGRGHGSYLQVAGQGAWSEQDADADAKAVQLGASNEHKPVRVNSKNKGHGGSVEQSNDVVALGAALNLNWTDQELTQEQTGYGSSYLQVAGQGAWSDQDAKAKSRAIQGGKKHGKHDKGGMRKPKKSNKH
jgi:hypothetical protein